MTDQNIQDMPTTETPEIPQYISPYPLDPVDVTQYGILRFTQRGSAKFDDYEIFRYLNDLWYVYNGNALYHFNGCVYEQIPEADLRGVVYRVIDQLLSLFPGEKPLMTEAHLKDLIAQYRNTHQVRDLPTISSEEYESSLGLVAFLNGILNLDTFNFLPFTPYIFISFQVQAMYNPALKTHKVEKIYKNIIPCDETREVFYRIAGYTIFSETIRTPAIFMLYGGGETGKTSLQKAMTNLMPTYSYSNLTMLDLADKFALRVMEGKRANFCGEADDRSSQETRISGALLKDISEGSKPLTVQKKFGDHYDIIPTAKPWFCSNVMPDFGDKTSGLYRRLHIIPCRVKQNWAAMIQDDMAEPDAKSWFANKCLEAYMEFLADGCKIVDSDDMKIELTSYMMQDNVMEFLMMEFGQVSDKKAIAEQLKGTSTSEFYSKYEAYCHTQGAKPLKSARFQERIRNEMDLTTKVKGIRLDSGSLSSRTVYHVRE